MFYLKSNDWNPKGILVQNWWFSQWAGWKMIMVFFCITFTHQHYITNVIFDPWRMGTCGKHACISVWLYCRHCITHMQDAIATSWLGSSRSSKESYEYAEANCWATPMLLRERQNLAIIPCVFFPCGLLKKKKKHSYSFRVTSGQTHSSVLQYDVL